MSVREQLARAMRALDRLRSGVTTAQRYALSALSLALLLATFGPMIALASGTEIPGWERLVHETSGPFCHQLPDRSFVLHNHVFPLCTRCSGMWIGITAGIALGLLLPFRRRWLVGLGTFVVGMALSELDHLREESWGGPGWPWVRFWLGLALFAGLTLAVSFDLLALLAGAGRWLRTGSPWPRPPSA